MSAQVPDTPIPIKKGLGIRGQIDERYGQKVPRLTNINSTFGVYSQTMALPTVPVCFTYNSTDHMRREKNGLPKPAMGINVAVRLPTVTQETADRLPTGVKELVESQGIRIEDLEVNFCVQDTPWQSNPQNPILFRAHPFLHSDAPEYSMNYDKSSRPYVGLTDINSAFTTLAQEPVRTHFIVSRDATGNPLPPGPKGYQVACSIQEYPIQAVDSNGQRTAAKTDETHAFYSLCIDPGPPKKAALTLHWLTSDKDLEEINKILRGNGANMTLNDFSQKVAAANTTLNQPKNGKFSPIAALNALVHGNNKLEERPSRYVVKEQAEKPALRRAATATPAPAAANATTINATTAQIPAIPLSRPPSPSAPQNPLSSPQSQVKGRSNQELVDNILSMKELFAASMDMTGTELFVRTKASRGWGDVDPLNMQKVKEYSEGLVSLLVVKKKGEVLAEPEKPRDFVENPQAQDQYKRDLVVYQKKMALFNEYEAAVLSLLVHDKKDKLLDFFNKHPEISNYMKSNMAALGGASKSFEKFTREEREKRDAKRIEKAPEKGKLIRRQPATNTNTASALTQARMKIITELAARIAAREKGAFTLPNEDSIEEQKDRLAHLTDSFALKKPNESPSEYRKRLEEDRKLIDEARQKDLVDKWFPEDAEMARQAAELAKASSHIDMSKVRAYDSWDKAYMTLLSPKLTATISQEEWRQIITKHLTDLTSGKEKIQYEKIKAEIEFLDKKNPYIKSYGLLDLVNSLNPEKPKIQVPTPSPQAVQLEFFQQRLAHQHQSGASTTPASIMSTQSAKGATPVAPAIPTIPLTGQFVVALQKANTQPIASPTASDQQPPAAPLQPISSLTAVGSGVTPKTYKTFHEESLQDLQKKIAAKDPIYNGVIIQEVNLGASAPQLSVQIPNHNLQQTAAQSYDKMTRNQAANQSVEITLHPAPTASSFDNNSFIVLMEANKNAPGLIIMNPCGNVEIALKVFEAAILTGAANIKLDKSDLQMLENLKNDPSKRSVSDHFQNLKAFVETNKATSTAVYLERVGREEGAKQLGEPKNLAPKQRHSLS